MISFFIFVSVFSPIKIAVFSSEEGSKIDLLDPPEVVAAKINSALCEKNSDENGVLAFYEFILFPIMVQHSVVVGNRPYNYYRDLKSDFENNKISETDLKETLKV